MSQDLKPTSQYPRDRFDDVESYTTQQGAHRKEFSTPRGAGQLNAIILAGGAALAIGVGAYLWLAPSDPLNMAAPEPTETVSAPVDEETVEPEEPTEEPEELVEPQPVEEPEPEESEASPTPEPTEEETNEPEDEVDYSLPISVYNASSIQGYAASIAQELGGAGFNVPVADNWTGNVPSQTTVYFSSDEATAVAVADEIGAVAVYEPTVEGVLVVLTAN